MIEPDQIEGKAKLFLDFEDRLTLFDTLILCRFYRDLYTWERLGEMIHAMTGFPKDRKDLKASIDAVSNIVRRFNIREGLTPEDDRLPKGLHRKLKQTGHTLTPEELEIMLSEYYELKGWNSLGIPK
jgi:aldehyde:ferredoxin oxidoreductase